MIKCLTLLAIMKMQTKTTKKYNSVQFSSVVQSCPTLYNLMDCSTAGFPVHHQLPEPSISSSVFPFSSRLQSFPASGSFQMSQFCASGAQSIGV